MLGGRSFVMIVVASTLPVSAAMAQEPELRILLAEDQGKFAVFQADKPPEDLRPSLGYLAFWSDYSGHSVYVFDRLIFTAKDAGHALLNLNDEFGANYMTLASLDPVYNQGLRDARREPPDPTPWILAGREEVLQVMGFDTSPGGGPLPCYVMQLCWRGTCNEPGTDVSDNDLAFLVDCQESPCIGPCCGQACCGDPCCGDPDPCCGDPCCGIDCNDGIECTLDWCYEGDCFHLPQGGSCSSDGDPCTDDRCNPDTLECEHIPDPDDIDCDGIPNPDDPDVDGDGIPNPFDPDVDGDGVPNDEDDDDDGDGVPDETDETPQGCEEGEDPCCGDPTPECAGPDKDNDGIPDAEDDDLDGDGILDVDDPDVDNDCTPNALDDDIDGDGILNQDDDDADGDGVSNDQDDDIDADDIPNAEDATPDGCQPDCVLVDCDDGDPCTTDSCDETTGECTHEPPDNDGDGLHNGEDPDVDGDGIDNRDDRDVDGDGIPNVNDPDIDGDCLSNGNDPDMDGDGILNQDDDDTDGDGIPNEEDSQPDGCEGQCCEIVCNANPCVLYDCDDGACSFYANRPDCTPCPEGLCLGGECWGDACTLGLTSGSAVAGLSAVLTLTTACSPPACGANVFWQITSANPAVQPFPANGVHYCPVNMSLISVQVQGCAPAGPTTLTVTGTMATGETCTTYATVDVSCPTDCVNYGEITTGQIIVGPVPSCVGGMVTFTLDGASDSGGAAGDDDGGPGGVCCEPNPAVNPIDAVPPTVTWTITRPSPLDPVEGTGYVASAIAEAVGDYSVTFTVSVDRECAPEPVTVGPETVTVAGADLDGDADQDGDIEIEGADDDNEDSDPGIIVLCNNDDDDQDSLPHRDNDIPEDLSIDNGPNSNDGDDLTRLVLRKVGELPDDWSIRLVLHSVEKASPGLSGWQVVRVFSNNVPGGSSIVLLGPGGVQGGAAFTLPENDPNHDADLAALADADVELWVEGLDFSAKVKLIVQVQDEQFNTRCEDQVQLKVAPIIMLPNTAQASRVVVSNIDAAFHGAIGALVGPGNVITIDVAAANDQWTQDAWEFGYSTRPLPSGTIQSVQQAFETQRPGALQDWGRGNLLGPTPGFPARSGLIQQLGGIDPDDDAQAYAYGGNIEVTPPLPGHPLGRIVVGTMTAAQAVQRSFLDRQGVQAPLIELTTSWLLNTSPQQGKCPTPRV